MREIKTGLAAHVTRSKNNMDYDIARQHAEPKVKGVLKDEKIAHAGFYTQENYPDAVRRIEFYDEEKDKTLAFLTNNFTLAASTIAPIYKARWQIELFFKWIKQNLKIKSFFGTSRNAVMTQVWVAMCSYLLLAHIKYRLKYAHSLLELSRLIRETLTKRKSPIDISSLKPEKLRGADYESIQAALF